jgi:hypothetical protein
VLHDFHLFSPSDRTNEPSEPWSASSASVTPICAAGSFAEFITGLSTLPRAQQSVQRDRHGGVESISTGSHQHQQADPTLDQ